MRTIVVKIDPVSDPIEGTVEHKGEPAVSFVGYMQLIAELERERRACGTDANAGTRRDARGRIRAETREGQSS